MSLSIPRNIERLKCVALPGCICRFLFDLANTPMSKVGDPRRPGIGYMHDNPCEVELKPLCKIELYTVHSKGLALLLSLETTLTWCLHLGFFTVPDVALSSIFLASPETLHQGKQITTHKFQSICLMCKYNCSESCRKRHGWSTWIPAQQRGVVNTCRHGPSAASMTRRQLA